MSSVTVTGGVLNVTGLTFTNVQGNATIGLDGVISIDKTSSIDIYGISPLFFVV